MNSIKRMISFVLAMIMVFSMGVFAFANTDDEITMNIYANDGMMMASHVNDVSGPWETNGIGISAKNGESFSDHGYSVTDPVFWDADRKFMGWEVQYEKQFSETDDNGETFTWMEWVEVPGSNILTTADMLAYKKTADYENIMFRAVWDGDDEDYYSHIGFHNFEGGFTLLHNDLEEKYNFGCGNRFREGYSIGAQTEKFEIKDIANPNNYTFEGWIAIECETGAVFAAEGEEYHLYTFADIVSAAVSDEDVDYFVKWKEIPISEYIGGGGGDEDPNVIFDCYGGYFIIQQNGEDVFESDMFFVNIDEGKKLSEDGFVVKEDYPKREEYTFKGWIEFNIDTKEFVLDEEGAPILWTSEEAIERATPGYEVCYLAKWEEIEFSQYVYGEGHETESCRNIGFFANGGENFETVVYEDGEKETGSCNIAQFGIEEGYSFAELLTEIGVQEYNLVPTMENGIISESWTLVKADEIMWKEFIIGSENVIGEDEEILYAETLGVYDRFLVAKNATVVSSKALTKDIFALKDGYSYWAVANWGEVQDVVIPGSNDEHKVVTDPAVKVPENLPADKKDKFDKPEKIQDEMKDKIHDKPGFDENKCEVVYMEISLVVKNDEGKFVPVTDDTVISGGIDIYIDYPEGTDARDFDFVVAHFKDNGEVEILEHEKTEKGLKVRVTSLSPFAIGYTQTAAVVPPVKTEVKNPIVIDVNKNNDKKGGAEENPNTGAPVFLP